MTINLRDQQHDNQPRAQQHHPTSRGRQQTSSIPPRRCHRSHHIAAHQYNNIDNNITPHHEVREHGNKHKSIPPRCRMTNISCITTSHHIRGRQQTSVHIIARQPTSTRHTNNNHTSCTHASVSFIDVHTCNYDAQLSELTFITAHRSS